MSYKIAIASGKGGTGKTTVSVNLNMFLKKIHNVNVQLVDCDVEEPNDLLFYPKATLLEEETIHQQIPSIITDNCTFCGQCEEYCEFNAITLIPNKQYIAVDHNLCHSCGACLEACQHNAIVEKPEEIGLVKHFKTPEGCEISEGRLKIGSPMQTMLIGQLKECINQKADITLFDAPPGTSCSVVETISDADYVILVAEPTRFGVHDFKLMVELARNLDKPFGVIINKSGLGDDSIYKLLKDENIHLLGEIPFSKTYASFYAKGKLTDDVPEEIINSYAGIITQLKLEF